MSRKEAKSKGEKRYTGSPCQYHPENTTRMTSNGSCVLCVRNRSIAWTKENRETVNRRKRERSLEEPAINMLQRARDRAKSYGIEYDLSLEDVLIPEFCPVLNIPLFKNEQYSGDNSPTIDRVDNAKGYTKDNILVVSLKANRIKNDSTLEELEKVYKFYANYR